MTIKETIERLTQAAQMLAMTRSNLLPIAVSDSMAGGKLQRVLCRLEEAGNELEEILGMRCLTMAPAAAVSSAAADPA